MLGEFITSILVLVLGYAYPAFECFKTVEKNRVGIEELRFWCQYWLPMYGEMKLALFIYLWYPKTKGSGYVYDTILKPYMIKHETDIDRNLQEFRARAWDLLVYYWENCTQLGQTTFFQVLDFLAAHVGKLRQPSLAVTTNIISPFPYALAQMHHLMHTMPWWGSASDLQFSFPYSLHFIFNACHDSQSTGVTLFLVL